MTTPDTGFENRIVRMTSAFPATDVFLKSAVIAEGLSELTEMTVEFLAKDRSLSLADVAGTRITVYVSLAEGGERQFTGICTSIRFLGLCQGFGHFEAKVRPWLWFLTKRRDNRIFQAMTALDVIKQVFSDSGFSDFRDATSATYAERDYCVQYRESDFDFVCRLMEEEGMFYYFEHEGEVEKLVLADSAGAYSPIPGESEVEFNYREKGYRRRKDHIFEWAPAEGVVSGKVTMTDYNFTTPSADLTSVTSIEKGAHSHKAYEIYEYPGHHGVAEEGRNRTRVAMEAEAAEHVKWQGVGNVRTMAVGLTFTLKGHKREQENQEYLITRAVHQLKIETDYDDDEMNQPLIRRSAIQVSEDLVDTYRCVFETIPKTTDFRAPKKTPWPRIPGMHTALVVGPSGEEIYTDEYGRIKVQFHWDRVGQKDENTTCWVRCVMPWTGSSWGFIAIPRIGQEVAIMFEEGDPDRPICTGMLYNAETMPPYGLPDNMTQTGIKTRSTKSGGADNYNELVFEDKKGEEFIRFHAEKDFLQTVENDAVVNIGVDKMDPGDLTQTIYRHRTETVKTGDSTFTVEEGNEIRTIATDQTEDVGNDVTRTVGNNRTETIGNDHTEDIGNNQTLTIGSDSSVTIGSNLTEDVGSNITIDAGQKITVTAGMEILLKVGGNSIKIDNSGITIKGIMIKAEGSAMLEAKSPLTTVKGDGILTLKGGLTLIN
ncbi:type VI secretion system Vgr family protein [Albidovulum sediminicola]|uniref:Type VI secretion system tip protein VgrG n=1 Tax=Albidovulum sediminicola TaxID=2984331 RepID=A0ABT2Z026_9RHOB|nr:type VI secretion system tip protein TssI/VgrG [Defluviimonas sp. WL0075]MCV2864493.1 type VI secretion system tip protein VgrG [Defluviimonas sp. WL0075]